MRKQLKVERRWIFLLTLAALFSGLIFLARRLPLWATTALGALTVTCLFELTCYYYSFLVILAPFAANRARELGLLFAMGIATQIAQLRVGWIDEEYFWVTVAVVIPLTLLFLSRLLDCWRETSSPKQPSRPEVARES